MSGFELNRFKLTDILSDDKLAAPQTHERLLYVIDSILNGKSELEIVVPVGPRIFGHFRPKALVKIKKSEEDINISWINRIGPSLLGHSENYNINYSIDGITRSVIMSTTATGGRLYGINYEKVERTCSITTGATVPGHLILGPVYQRVFSSLEGYLREGRG